MSDLRVRVVSGVLNFLRTELGCEDLDAEDREGLEVAVQCLENIFDVRSERYRSNEPTLAEMYKFYLENPHLNRRESTEEEKAEGEALKTEANLAMNDGRHTQALHLYTRAIECNPRNPVYYCNRAAAKCRMNDHTAAVRDCNIAIQLDPRYCKAYGRLGLAYWGLERYVLAVECYKKAHQLEPDNEEFKNNLDLAVEKVKEMCTTGPETSTGQDDGHTRTSQPSVDIGQLFNIASDVLNQVLSRPALQSFGRNLDIFNQPRPDTGPSTAPPENESTSYNHGSP